MSTTRIPIHGYAGVAVGVGPAVFSEPSKSFEEISSWAEEHESQGRRVGVWPLRGVPYVDGVLTPLPPGSFVPVWLSWPIVGYTEEVSNAD